MRLPAENIKTAREVQLVDFLNTYRPGELVRKSRDEYCTKSHSSLRITPSKNLFHWCSQSKGGRGALDYLLTVEGMSFRSAVMLLNEMELVPFQQARAATVESSRTHDFTLPRPDGNAQAATSYLMHRGISPKVLRYCLNEGILYQTTRGNYRNCVFVGKDEGGVPRSAFQRSCSKPVAVCSTCMSTTGWKASAARLRKVLTNGGGTYSMSTATKNATVCWNLCWTTPRSSFWKTPLNGSGFCRKRR